MELRSKLSPKKYKNTTTKQNKAQRMEHEEKKKGTLHSPL